MTDQLSQALETIARLGAKYPPACPLCNDTGEQRYWEGRWRDEKAENERLRAALKAIAYMPGSFDSTEIVIRQTDIAVAALNQQSATEPK